MLPTTAAVPRYTAASSSATIRSTVYPSTILAQATTAGAAAIRSVHMPGLAQHRVRVPVDMYRQQVTARTAYHRMSALRTTADAGRILPAHSPTTWGYARAHPAHSAQTGPTAQVRMLFI